MSDLRYDPVSGVWVTIARNRLERPSEFVPGQQSRPQLICPFCRGNEEETPSTICAYREDGSLLTPADDQSGWVARVVPNKFPSFTESSSRVTDAGPWQISSASGAQELIIPSARHITTMGELQDAELKVSFLAAQQRINVMKVDSGITHAMLFLNCGAAAGASIGHVHFQLIGSPVLSGYLNARVEAESAHRAGYGTGLVQQLMMWEREQKTRLICESESFTAFCPFASRFAFQVWIVPRDGNESFTGCGADLRDEFAEMCREVVRRFETHLEGPSYNWLLHIPPFSETGQPGYWYAELFPRLTFAAGYELGTNTWVNPVPPEAAARRLRGGE